MQTETEDQPMYYEGNFVGEWECEREARVLGYKMIVGVCILLVIAGSLMYLRMKGFT